MRGDRDLLGDDMLDSRTIEDRIGYLEDTEDEDEKAELAIWVKLREECEDYGWRDGIGFICDSYFEAYAEELAEDIGAINKDARWPNGCIDWERAAQELQQDYTSTEIGGFTYWYREA